MIILFGHTGYIGNEFKNQLEKLKLSFFCWPNSSKTTFDDLEKWYIKNKHLSIDTVINAAGFTGKPNVDVCELDKTNTIHGNIIWTQILTNWCELHNIPLGHVSSGCIFTGKRLDGKPFTEDDEPNFTFKQNNCSFYSGTKAIAEDIVKKYKKHYIWRLRILFEEYNNNRNYISKLLKYEKLLDAENSISNKQEFVDVSIQSILRKIPYGIYNVTNTGYINTHQMVEKLKQTIAKDRNFILINEEELYKNFAKTPRSNCVLDNSKILETGLKIKSVDESIDYCLNNWKY